MQSKIDRWLPVKLLGAALLFTFLLFLAGCSKSSSPTSSQQSSNVQGQVSGQPSLSKPGKNFTVDSGIQGATVTLAQVQADGSLKTVSTASVQTDVNGHFSVNTDLDGVSNLIVVASHGSSQWETTVSAAVKSGTTVYCQPLTEETTVQSQTYSKVVADGKSSEVTSADIQLLVNASVAASVSGSASAVAQLAASLEAEAETRASAFAQFGITQSELQAAATARTQAQASLESSLNSAAGSSSADTVALQSYYAATIAAYVAAGVPIEVIAKTEDESCAALTNTSATMSAQAAFSVRQSASLIRAVLIGQAVAAKMQVAGASQSEITAASNANAVLFASIVGAATSSDIASAFASYHAAVLAQLQATAGTSASAVATADSNINASGGARAALQTTVSAAVTTSAVVQAYSTFYTSVGAAMQGMSGMSSAQLDATTQVLILINSNV